MPYLEFEEPEFKGLRMWYLCNPTSSALVDLSAPPPDSSPLDPAKPSLVMLHAGLTSSASFEHQYQNNNLKAFNLIAFDARMSGRTTGDELDSFTISDSADTFLRALEMLGVERYSVLGEGSGGCGAATWMAIKQPSRVQALVLVSPGHFETEP
ncbi:hypothetical protein MNV49_000482 [Pseudohyphozyma bogoriensis]|nr:hypothetical protein MNV49_000482 [Pseudohyphozyma bogoriensis]